MAEKILSSAHPRIFRPGGKLWIYSTKIAADVYFKAFKSLQFTSYEKVRAMHEKRVVSLIKKARKTNFYHEYLAKINTIADFYQIKTIGKELMRKEAEIGSVINPNLSHFKLNRWTSGSTGVPFNFLMDENMASRRIALYRLTLQWVGRRPEDSVILIMPFSHPFLEEEYTLFSCRDPEDLEMKFAEVTKLFENKSIILQTRTSYLIRLAQLLEKHQKQFSFRAVISYTEELTEEMRTYLEQTLQAPIFNYYGCNEVNLIGHECELKNGFHVNMGWTYCEVVDEQNRPLGPKKVGNIVVTSLDNEVMPFIRYETGDRGYWLYDPCQCGRTFPRIKIEGRKSGIFSLPDGTAKYAWQLLWPITSRVEKIKKYRATRLSPSKFEIHIVPTENFTPRDQEEIIKELNSYLGPSVQAELKITESISSPAGGKQQPFINLYKDI